MHGLHQYRPGDPVRAATELAIRWGALIPAARAASGAVVEMAYYADLTRKPGAYAEPLNLERLDADAWSLAVALCAAWLPDLRRDDGRLRVSLRTALGILAGRRRLLGKAVHGYVVAYARETARFRRESGGFTPYEAVLSRVARRIEGADVVVAHSLGAAVAYETLRRYSRIEIPLLVTLGAPIALPGAASGLRAPSEADGRPARPGNVGRWIDVLDSRDLFAVPGHRAAESFDGVTGVYAPGAGFDFHRPDGYLAGAALAEALRG